MDKKIHSEWNSNHKTHFFAFRWPDFKSIITEYYRYFSQTVSILLKNDKTAKLFTGKQKITNYRESGYWSGWRELFWNRFVEAMLDMPYHVSTTCINNYDSGSKVDYAYSLQGEGEQEKWIDFFCCNSRGSVTEELSQFDIEESTGVTGVTTT